MSFATCLAQLKADGVIDAARAERFEQLYAEMEETFRRRYGDTPAAVLAGEETIRALEYDAALSRRQSALQIEAQRKAYADMERFNGKSDGAAIRAMMGNDARAPFGNVEVSTERLDFQAHAMLSDFIERHSRDLMGQSRDKAGLEDVVRARHGQPVTSKTAKAFSDAIGEVFESLRQRFNAAGGDIGHIADYGVPHSHDARRVRAVSFDRWRSDILPDLDVGRMVDPLTGGAFNDASLDAFLRGTYENIRTDGMAGLGASTPGGSSKLANRRGDPRFLHFKDGDAWLRYNAKYGTADPFTAIFNHIHGMNRDIAMLERFGPNPNTTVDWLIDQMKRKLAQSDDKSATPLNVATTEAAAIRQMWKTVNGENDIPLLGGPLRSTVVKSIHGTRDILTAAFLGSSPISAISDANTIRMAKGLNGLHGSVLMGYLRQLNPLSAADRKLAVTLELGMRDATQAMLGLNRYFGQSQSPAITKIIADSALRITGINKLTEAGQRQFGLDFLGGLANARAKPFAKLHPGMRDALLRYGLDEGAWDVMRASPVHKERGGEWMSGRLITDRAIGERMMDMILAETVAAVQVQTAHSRALTNWGPQGSLAGEASRNLLQFKTFTAAIMMTQGQRIMMQGPLRGPLYFANFLIGMTLFGAATTQLRQIIKGEDPLPMDTPGFWGQALLQSGGIGILGDIIYSFKNDHGGGLPGLFAGPWVGAANDIGGKAAHEIKALAQGKKTRFGRDATDILRRYVPGGSTWYLRLGFQRLVVDQLQALIDPQYRRSWARMGQARRQDGTDFYWGPGETAPDAPDVSNIFGESF